jgi:hypothetical protein
MTKNRHPVDELADLRSQIKALRAREEELRRPVIASGNLTGDEFEARLSRSVQERVDVPALKRELGLQALKPYLRSLACDVLRVKPKKEEA